MSFFEYILVEVIGRVHDPPSPLAAHLFEALHVFTAEPHQNQETTMEISDDSISISHNRGLNNTSPTSVASALRLVLENPVLSDVEIHATDGTRLSAHRIILASRSQVFMQLLAGGFSEAKSTVVDLGFEGDVLKAMLEYCYTDEVSFISPEKDCEESMVPVVIGIASAADYFALPKLCEQVVDWSTAQMKKNPALAWSFLVEAESSSHAEVWSARARQVMSCHTETCLSLGQDRLGGISLWALEQVASDDDMPVDETELFNLIASWKSSVADDDNNNNSRKRKADAAGLVSRHVCLDRMTASDLATVVAPSELATSSQLLEAYKALAAGAEAAGFRTAACLRGPRWETSQLASYQSTEAAQINELLDCKPMKKGKHRWSIEVTTMCLSMWVGLANISSGAIDRTIFLGHYQHGWMYGRDGSKCHAANREHDVLPDFDEGDILTFTLDLSGPICLKVCVNNDEEKTMFDHDKLIPTGGDAYAFVPAVSMDLPGAVRFCGFLSV